MIDTYKGPVRWLEAIAIAGAVLLGGYWAFCNIAPMVAEPQYGMPEEHFDCAGACHR